MLPSGDRSDLPYYLSAADGSACEIAGVSARWRYMHPAARLFFSSAPFFNVEGGDKHPAAHVFNPEQARLERAFVCWGGCFSAAFPCAPFQPWRRASCRTWASSFCSAVPSSNLPKARPTPKTSSAPVDHLAFMGCEKYKPMPGSCLANHICPPKLRVQRAMHKCNTLLQVALCGSCPAIRRFNHVRQCSWNTQER